MTKGFCKHHHNEGLKTACDIGLDPEGMAKAACPAGQNHKDGMAFRIPCRSPERTKEIWGKMSDGQLEAFSARATCSSYIEPTKEELATQERDINKLIDGVAIARPAIIEELKRRAKNGDESVKAAKKEDLHRWHMPQKNYFTGAGEMDCPVCKTGKLRYSRASYNGHVHAKCSTQNCVAWME